MEGELFLPAIITHIDDDERVKLYTKLQKHMVAGKFVGRHVNGRPSIRITPKHKRKQIAIYAAHVVLVMNGLLPNEDEQASHLCHNRACVKLEHLVWESPGHNMRRKRCQAGGKCVCKLQPPCILQCLP